MDAHAKEHPRPPVVIYDLAPIETFNPWVNEIGHLSASFVGIRTGLFACICVYIRVHSRLFLLTIARSAPLPFVILASLTGMRLIAPWTAIPLRLCLFAPLR